MCERESTRALEHLLVKEDPTKARARSTANYK